MSPQAPTIQLSHNAAVAQWIEYWPPKPRVVGSIPASRTKSRKAGAYSSQVTLTPIVNPVFAMSMPWIIFCDGSASPNPGRMGIGAVLTEPDGTRHTLSQVMPERGCNNEAELLALMAALRELKVRGAKSLLAYSDNSILIEQLVSSNAKPVARLAPLFNEARALLAQFDDASLKWVPRHRNREADELARAALGLAPKSVPKELKKQRKNRH